MYYKTYLLWFLPVKIVKYIFCKIHKNKNKKNIHPCKTASELDVTNVKL